MFSDLAAKLSPYSLLIKAGLILIVIGALTSYYFWSQAKINGLKKDVGDAQIIIQEKQNAIDSLVVVNKDNQMVIKTLKDDYDRSEEARKKIKEKVKIIEVSVDKTSQEISKAPESDNGPVAPVLKNTIKAIQLREAE